MFFVGFVFCDYNVVFHVCCIPCMLYCYVIVCVFIVIYIVCVLYYILCIVLYFVYCVLCPSSKEECMALSIARRLNYKSKIKKSKSNQMYADHQYNSGYRKQNYVRKILTVPHTSQQDGFSCGVFVIKV